MAEVENEASGADCDCWTALLLLERAAGQGGIRAPRSHPRFRREDDAIRDVLSLHCSPAAFPPRSATRLCSFALESSRESVGFLDFSFFFFCKRLEFFSTPFRESCGGRGGSGLGGSPRPRLAPAAEGQGSQRWPSQGWSALKFLVAALSEHIWF